MLAPAEDQHVTSAPVTKNKTKYEHETVNVFVKQLEGIVEAAKGNLVSEARDKNAEDKDTAKENQFELSISKTLWVKQNSSSMPMVFLLTQMTTNMGGAQMVLALGFY